MQTALKMLAAATNGTFDFWGLAGPDNARTRAEIMTALAGRRVPQAKSGVTALRAAFHEIAQPQGDHLAARTRAFANWARGQIAT